MARAIAKNDALRDARVHVPPSSHELGALVAAVFQCISKRMIHTTPLRIHTQNTCVTILIPANMGVAAFLPYSGG